jgi:hypothetical protein
MVDLYTWGSSFFDEKEVSSSRVSLFFLLSCLCFSCSLSHDSHHSLFYRKRLSGRRKQRKSSRDQTEWETKGYPVIEAIRFWLLDWSLLLILVMNNICIICESIDSVIDIVWTNNGTLRRIPRHEYFLPFNLIIHSETGHIELLGWRAWLDWDSKLFSVNQLL